MGVLLKPSATAARPETLYAQFLPRDTAEISPPQRNFNHTKTHQIFLLFIPSKKISSPTQSIHNS